MTAMRGLWSQAEAALDQSLEEIREVRARAERAEAALEEARTETALAQKAEAEAEAARFRHLAWAEKVEEALEVAQRQAANELDNVQVVEEKQRVVEEKQKAAEAEIYLLKHRLHSATIEIGVAGERAENAEEIAHQRDAEAAHLRAAVTEAEKKVVEAEEKAAEAEKKTVEAVEDFRKSKAFNRELAETTAFAYDGGFQDCKEKIRRLYDLERIEELEPDEAPEDDGLAPTEP